MENRKLLEFTLSEFSNRLSSGAPPGGGSAAAYAACMAACLISMVAKVVLRKENSADSTAKLRNISRKSEELKTLFADLVDADAAAFEPVTTAYRLPKGTNAERNARSAAVQVALRGACQTSIRTVEGSVELLELAQQISVFGGSSIICDVETAIHLGHCALQSAFTNANSDMRALKDTDFVESQVSKLQETVRKGLEIYEQTLSDIARRR